MADFLIIGNIPLRVLTSNARRLTPQRIGRSSRAHDGSLRSTQRDSKRQWSFEVEPLDTSAIDSLESSIPDGSFQDCSGAALGDESGYSTIECQVLYGDMPFEEDEPGISFKQTVNITLIEV